MYVCKDREAKMYSSCDILKGMYSSCDILKEMSLLPYVWDAVENDIFRNVLYERLNGSVNQWFHRFETDTNTFGRGLNCFHVLLLHYYHVSLVHDNSVIL